MSEIQILASIVVGQEVKEGFIELMREVVGESRKEAGCSRYDLVQNIQNPLAFTVIETWASQEAIDTHNATPHFKKLGEFIGKNPVELGIASFKQVL